MTEPRTWTIEMPAGMELLNANQRLHWAPKARITKALRDAAYILTKKAKIPALDMAYIIGEYQPPTSAKRDVADLYPSFKAAIDGVVDAGVLTDDDDSHLVGPDMRLGPRFARGRLVLHIAEWSQANRELLAKVARPEVAG